MCQYSQLWILHGLKLGVVTLLSCPQHLVQIDDVPNTLM